MPALIFVTPRKFLVPFPSALNDCVERLELRLPAKLLFDLVGGGDEPRRVAGPAWFFDRLDFSARDFAAGFNYLSNAGAAAGTEIVTSAVRCPRARMCARARSRM